jgi:protein Mpv17
MTVAEGGGKRAVSHKLRDMFVPTLKANYVVWPAVQILNFRVIPIQFQLVSFYPQMQALLEVLLT